MIMEFLNRYSAALKMDYVLILQYLNDFQDGKRFFDHGSNMFFIRVTRDTRGVEILAGMDSRIFDIPWTAPQWRGEVENENNRVYIISADEELLFPVGFLTYGISGEDIELKKIAVMPDHRRKQIAGLAIEKMLEDARNDDMHNVIAEVAITNLAAIGLYEKYGFYKVSIRKKYYNNLVDAIVMQKEI